MQKLFISTLLLLSSIFCWADEARLLRFPSVGGDKIAFTYAGDLYTVSINGGKATKLTSDIGFEMFSRFSPDGKSIAFTGQYDGNTEVFTIPSEGGMPKRVTYTALVDRDLVGERMGPDNIVMCWTPDGKNIVFRSKWYNFSGLRGQLLLAPVDGGDLKRIPTTEGGFCSFSADGKKLAMNRMFREFRTWKYYAGGQADDIWINTLGTTQLENITNHPAQDIFPMWVGEKIYFLSDRDHIMNLFCYDSNTKQITKQTNFNEYDCKFPSYSQDWIVFENGGYIYKYSTKDASCTKVSVTLNDEGLFTRTNFTSRSDQINSQFRIGGGAYSIAPDGSRIVTTYRGDIFSIPGGDGATYNLSRSPSSQERDVTWSPDGKFIAYFSDESGEYQIYIKPTDGKGKPIQLTKFKSGYPEYLNWSNDSKRLYYTTEKRVFYSLDIATKKTKKIFQGDYSGVRGYSISKDDSWIAFASTASNKVSVIYLYDVAADKYYPVTSKWYDSFSPLFSEDGKYLFFSSARVLNPQYSRIEWNAVYSVENYLFVIPLSKETPSPTYLKGSEYEVKTEVAAATKPDTKKSEAKSPMKVDIDGIVERTVSLPLSSGGYRLVGSLGDELYFSINREVKKISMKDLKVSPVTKATILAASSDFKKALISENGKHYIASSPNFRGEKVVNTSDIDLIVNYPEEWKQIFYESWRITRDHFYLENMHGKDWNKIKAKYEVLLPYVHHRHDLTYIIGEMIAELNVGHAYITSGEAPSPKRISMGLLGGQFSKDKSGYFKIDKIWRGETWGNALRSPLYESAAKVGDYVISVNEIPCKEMGSIYESLIGKVGQTVALKINSTPSEEGAKIIYLKPIASESGLAYYEWVQNNMKKVEEASNGEIGYIHIPDMGVAGLTEFTKLFYTQLDKKALIIDDRMNGGGNVSPMIIERLSRVIYRISMYRNGHNEPVPNETHYGPKVCLVDKYSSSDGDLFPYSFQKLGLGKVIGTRTWGGIVGISGSKKFVDGQDMRTPFFTSYSTEGTWIVENHGIDPDIVVDINPFEDYLGNDAQLNKAIEVLKEELKNFKPLPGTPKDRVMP